MNNNGSLVYVIIGYIIGIISPILGLLYGAVLFYTKRDTPLYNKHSRFIMIFAIIVWIIYTVIKVIGIF